MKAIFILSVVTIQALWLFRPLVPYIEYALNHEYISEVLCINKEKPQLECDGKCYLKARIQEEAQPQSEDRGTIPVALEWDVLFAAWFSPAQSALLHLDDTADQQNVPFTKREVFLFVLTPPPQMAG